MTKTYNKLVRDRIPEIIESTGKSCLTRVLSDAEYIRMLDEKLNEELAEYQNKKDINLINKGMNSFLTYLINT